MERPAGDGLIAIINPATNQRTFRAPKPHELDPTDPHYAPEIKRFNEALLLEGDPEMIEMAEGYWPNGKACKPVETQPVGAEAATPNIIPLPGHQQQYRLAPAIGHAAAS